MTNLSASEIAKLSHDELVKLEGVTLLSDAGRKEGGKKIVPSVIDLQQAYFNEVSVLRSKLLCRECIPVYDVAGKELECLERALAVFTQPEEMRRRLQIVISEGFDLKTGEAALLHLMESDRLRKERVKPGTPEGDEEKRKAAERRKRAIALGDPTHHLIEMKLQGTERETWALHGVQYE
jgi:hypothetical protein